MRELLGRFVLNFECCLLNVHNLDMDENSDHPLGPILYIMQRIFNLDKEVILKLAARRRDLADDDDRSKQIMMAMKYIMRVDPGFTGKL